MLAYSSGPYLVRHPWRANSSRLSEPQNSNLFVRRLVFNSLTFFQISPKSSARFRCVTSPTPCHPVPSSQAIVTSLSGTSAPRARYHLHQGLHLTNHVLSRKVLSQAKLKVMNRNPLAITLQKDFHLKDINLKFLEKIQNKSISIKEIFISLLIFKVEINPKLDKNVNELSIFLVGLKDVFLTIWCGGGRDFLNYFWF